MTRTVNVHQAKTHLSRLLDDVRSGEEVIIAKAGVPYARLVPIAPPGPRRLGFLPELAPLADTVLAPLDDDDLEQYERLVTRYLLDTHTLVWAVATPSRLSRRAAGVLSDETNELLVSAASAWEVSTKHRLGKLPGAEPLLAGWDDALRTLRAASVPITHSVALRSGSYASSHRDPFDRLLAAEAELSGVGLVTADGVFADFPVRVIW